MSISVITPSVREKGLKLVDKALKRQTFKNYEWRINDKRYDGGFWGLNRAYNDLIRGSKGELLVSWQDYTYAEPDTLERFWEHYQAEPKTVVGAVGNKYEEPDWMVRSWQDPRERDDQGTFYEVYPADVEWNLCSVPKCAVEKVGGFDEELDYLGFGMDGYSVNYRMDEVGYVFKLDQSIKSYSLEHDRPDGWDENNLLGKKYNKRREELIKGGKWPNLKYL